MTTKEIIADQIKAVTNEKQCADCFWRGDSGTFCVGRAGHEGDHRGSGCQWTQAGVRVKPPTLNERGEPKKAKA